MSEEKWDATQKKTYTRWMNSFLKRRGKAVDELFAIGGEGAKGGGIMLINLLEIIGGESLNAFGAASKRKWYEAPKNVMQRGENLQLCIDYVKSKGIELVNIGSGDLEKGNKKIILGLIFTIILRFSVADLDGKKGLLLWCQRSTEKHAGVNITNFTNSFTDGLAFCAIINRYRPDMLDYESLNKKDAKGNLELAFATAQKLGIDRLLDVEDLLDNPAPDEKSIIAYVIEYWRLFSKGAANEQLVKIIMDSLRIANQLKEQSAKYNYDAAELANWIAEKSALYGNETFPDFTEGIVDAIGAFNEYTRNAKADKRGKLVALEALFQQINSQAASNGLKEFVPTAGHDPHSLKANWASLGTTEDSYKAAALSKYDRFLRYDYNVRLFDGKQSRLLSWIDENASVFASNHVGSTVEECDAKLDAYAIFKTNFASCKGTHAELARIAGKIGKEHHAYGQVADGLLNLGEKLNSLEEAGTVYQSNILSNRDNIQKLNTLQKQFYVKAEELLFKIEALEEIVAQPVLEGSEEGLQELSTILAESFAKKFAETSASVAEFKSIAATLEAGGKTLTRNADEYDGLLEELSGKLNARNRSLALKLGVVRKDEDLKSHFAAAAAAFTASATSVTAAVGNLTGGLEAQQASLSQIEAGFRTEGKAKLEAAATAWEHIEAAGILVVKNTSETIYSLNATFAATLDTFASTSASISGLIAQRDGAKAEEAERINEIRKAFNFFDTDHNNVLRDTELKQAVEGLGLDISDSAVEAYYGANVNSTKGGVEFEKFVDFVKAHTASGTGKNEVMNAFVTLSKGSKLTEDILKVTFAENPELILSALEDHKTPEGFDYKAYIDSIYN